MSEAIEETPLVSVVVPVHRGEPFLAAALASVAAQTHPAVEVIVVDDGSPDGSAEIAAAWSGVRLLRQANLGVAAARNAGLALARGSLVAFLDQDDEWAPGRLAVGIAHLRAHSDVAVVLCHTDMVLIDGTPRPAWFREEWIGNPQPGYTPSTWLVRRDAFDEIGTFDTSYQVACDSDWLARAKDAGLGIGMLPDALVRWRVHGANGSYEQAVMRSEILRMARESAARQRSAQRSGP